jgi:hypothetical protein
MCEHGWAWVNKPVRQDGVELWHEHQISVAAVLRCSHSSTYLARQATLVNSLFTYELNLERLLTKLTCII